MQLPFLDETELRQRIDMRDAIDAMRSAFRQLSTGEAEVPVRTGVTSDETLALFMPGWLPKERALGAKVVTVCGRNASVGLPLVHAVVLLIDASTGLPEAVLDATWLTALRTGAGAGLATDLLAREDAEVLAVVGAGAQAVTQVEAVLTVRAIREVRIRSRSEASARRFLREARERWRDSRPEVDFRVELDPVAHIAGADVIATATDALRPVLPEEVDPGTHINAVGAYTPEMRELPGALVGRAHLVVDQRAAAWKEAGDLIIAADEGRLRAGAEVPELGEVVAGTRRGRTEGDQITIFKSVGSAAQDLAVARMALDAR